MKNHKILYLISTILILILLVHNGQSEANSAYGPSIKKSNYEIQEVRLTER